MNPIRGADPSGLLLLDLVMSLWNNSRAVGINIATRLPIAQFASMSQAAINTALTLFRTVGIQLIRTAASKQLNLRLLSKTVDRAIRRPLMRKFRNEIKNSRIFPLIQSLYPEAYDHQAGAIIKTRRFRLTFMPGISAANRAVATSVALQRYGPNLDPSKSMDEYPYASTREGGKRNRISVKYIDHEDNVEQGRQLNGFYWAWGRRPNTKFFVVPIPTDLIEEILKEG